MTSSIIPPPVPAWPGAEITPYQPIGWLDNHMTFGLRPGARIKGLILKRLYIRPTVEVADAQALRFQQSWLATRFHSIRFGWSFDTEALAEWLASHCDYVKEQAAATRDVAADDSALVRWDPPVL